MPPRREKSPGSFQDELGRVIERVAPNYKAALTKPAEPHKQRVTDSAELNDRLFEQAWKRPGS